MVHWNIYFPIPEPDVLADRIYFPDSLKHTRPMFGEQLLRFIQLTNLGALQTLKEAEYCSSLKGFSGNAVFMTYSVMID